MALSAFDDRDHKPTDAQLARTLGPAHAQWQRARELVAERVPELRETWGFTSASTGWGLRLARGKRVLLYLTPGDGSFLASTALGEKAVAAARERRYPKAFLALLDEAPRFAEGRGVRLTVRLARDLASVERLVALKLET
jgi:hypothetical protein